MGFVLYLALVLYGNQVMTSVVDEKSNRIAEVLVSSLSPFQLMLGKVVGVGSVGLAQLGIWGVTATLVTTYRAPLAKLFGLSANAAAAIKMPEFRPDVLVVFLVFFVLGFLLYAAAYAAIAALCNSPQEAQQANSPITMMLVGVPVPMKYTNRLITTAALASAAATGAVSCPDLGSLGGGGTPRDGISAFTTKISSSARMLPTTRSWTSA